MPVKAGMHLTTSDHPDPMTADAVAEVVAPLRPHFVASVGSTSDLAANLLADDALVPPAAVVADVQTTGRGRMGRRWHSGEHRPTGVTATFVFHRLAPPPHHLPLLAAILVRRALARFDNAIDIKWPNDLLLGGGKVAGILCERKSGHDLIGVGVNVYPTGQPPADMAYPVASLGDMSPPPQRLAVLESLCQFLATMPTLPAEAWAAHRAEYERHHLLTGRRVELTWQDTAGEQRTIGPCHGADADGRLCVGDRAFISGSVRLR